MLTALGSADKYSTASANHGAELSRHYWSQSLQGLASIPEAEPWRSLTEAPEAVWYIFRRAASLFWLLMFCTNWYLLLLIPPTSTLPFNLFC